MAFRKKSSSSSHSNLKIRFLQAFKETVRWTQFVKNHEVYGILCFLGVKSFLTGLLVSQDFCWISTIETWKNDQIQQQPFWVRMSFITMTRRFLWIICSVINFLFFCGSFTLNLWCFLFPQTYKISILQSWSFHPKISHGFKGSIFQHKPWHFGTSESELLFFLNTGDWMNWAMKKRPLIPGCLGDLLGIKNYPCYVGIIWNHYKDPYQTTRIQWKVRGFFVSWLNGVFAFNKTGPSKGKSGQARGRLLFFFGGVAFSKA